MSFQTQEIKVKGLTCSGCVNTLSKVLLSKEGVKEVSVDLENGIARVKFNVYKFNRQQIVDIINDETPYEAL
jgi:copper chaperone